MEGVRALGTRRASPRDGPGSLTWADRVPSSPARPFPAAVTGAGTLAPTVHRCRARGAGRGGGKDALSRGAHLDFATLADAARALIIQRSSPYPDIGEVFDKLAGGPSWFPALRLGQEFPEGLHCSGAVRGTAGRVHSDHEARRVAGSGETTERSLGQRSRTLCTVSGGRQRGPSLASRDSPCVCAEPLAHRAVQVTS